MPTPGGELIRAMAAGNRDAFAQLYARYAALVLAFVLRIVRERADAVEVLQDVFWEAWRGAAVLPARPDKDAAVPLTPHSEPASANTAPRKPASCGMPGIWNSSSAVVE